MKKALVAFNLERVHLEKDVFLFPYYICKKYGYTLDVATCELPTNADLPETHRESRIIRIKNPDRKDAESVLTDFIKQHAAEYDFLILFHYRAETIKRSKLYKAQNPLGVVYVKLDMNIDGARMFQRKNLAKQVLSKIRLSAFSANCDIYSIESSSVYEALRKVWSSTLTDSRRFALLPNGFDDEMLQNTGIEILPYEKKENLLISAGRLGTYQKNTEFLLHSLDKIDFKGWKVKLLGPYTEELITLHKRLCKKNPAYAQAVEFVGNVTDKKILFDYYTKAKIFCLPSRWEAFALVLVEAMRFGDYIITSPITSANDLTDCARTGSIVPLEEEVWVKEIQHHIDDETELRAAYQEIIALSGKKFRMKNIIDTAQIFERVLLREKV